MDNPLADLIADMTVLQLQELLAFLWITQCQVSRANIKGWRRNNIDVREETR